MELLVAVLLGGSCAALGAYLLRRRRRRLRQRPGRVPTQRQAAIDERDLDDLRPDDVLTINGSDWIVMGVARLSEGADNWIECRLEDGSNERWLLVYGKEDHEVVFGQRIIDPGVGSRPSASLDIQGSLFSLQRQGRATVLKTGNLGEDYPKGSCTYWDYQQPGDERVWIRGLDAKMLYVAGERVQRHLVDFLPGS